MEPVREKALEVEMTSWSLVRGVLSLKLRVAPPVRVRPARVSLPVEAAAPGLRNPPEARVAEAGRVAAPMRVAPLAMVMLPEEVLVPAKRSVPALRWIGPEKVLALVRVTVPVVDLVKVPVPWRTAVIRPLSRLKAAAESEPF